MREELIHYPIIEALCEFHFEPAQSWDITIPGIFYERIKDKFPIKEQRVGLGVTISPEKGVVQQKVDLQHRIRFWSNDRSSVIQVGPNLLAINQLRPYRNWEAYKPIILDNLGIYIEIVKPKAFKRIVLRYINHIILKNHEITLNEYFNFCPLIPPELPQTVGSFNVKVEFPIDKFPEILSLNFMSAPIIDSRPVEGAEFRLELNYILRQGELLSFEEADGWIEKGKRILNNAFKACITEKCLRSFKEGGHGISGV